MGDAAWGLSFSLAVFVVGIWLLRAASTMTSASAALTRGVRRRVFGTRKSLSPGTMRLARAARAGEYCCAVDVATRRPGLLRSGQVRHVGCNGRAGRRFWNGFALAVRRTSRGRTLPRVWLGALGWWRVHTKKFEEGQWEAYLGSGEDVFIAREGMTLAGIYRVRSIQPPTMTLMYLPLKQSQTIAIGGVE